MTFVPIRLPSPLHLQANAIHFFDQLSKPTSSCWLLSYLHPSPQHRGWWDFQFQLRGHLSHPALLLVTLFFFFFFLACLGKFSLSLSLYCQDFLADLPLEKDFLSSQWQTFSPDLVPSVWSRASVVPFSLYSCHHLHAFDYMLEELSFSSHKHFWIFFPLTCSSHHSDHNWHRKNLLLDLIRKSIMI